MNDAPRAQFKAVLSARANDGRPSDLEFLLRSHCQKIKVVKKLSGAHLMIKQDSTSLAVRAYFAHSLQELNEQGNHKLSNNANEENYDFDDLFAFLKGFKVSIIFFILQLEEQRNQLDDPMSFFQRAQKLVHQVAQSEVGKIARIFLLSNPAKAVDLLHSFSKTLHPSTKEKKHKYFAQKHQQLFLPQPTFIPTTSHPHGAKHVRQTIVDWANRFECPVTEADVMCNMMKNLRTIASADDRVLQGIPLEPRTKQCMMLFFGTSPQEPIPSDQIHLSAELPTSPLTIPEDMRLHQQQQSHFQHQGQVFDQHQQYSQPPPPQLQHRGHAFDQHSHSQVPHPPPMHPPMQNPPMMRAQSQMGGGLARFGGNPSQNRGTTMVQTTNSFAQYSASRGLSNQGNHHQNPPMSTPSRFGPPPPPTRTIYQQETILTAIPLSGSQMINPYASIPQHHGNMQYPMQASTPGMHHREPPMSQQYNNRSHSFHPPMANHHHHNHGQMAMSYGGGSQHESSSVMGNGSVMGNFQQHPYAMHPGGANPIASTPRYAPDPAATPMSRRPIHGPPRNLVSFPPRRPRRFVP